MNNIINSTENFNGAIDGMDVTQCVTADEAAAEFATDTIKLTALMAHVPDYEGIPKDLKDVSNWVGFGSKKNLAAAEAEAVAKAETKAKTVKRKLGAIKTPINPSTGGNALTTKKTTWGLFPKAKALVDDGVCKGIGFVFDGKVDAGGLCLAGVDLDTCVDSGKPTPAAMDIIKRFNSYTEFSPSGLGIHIICKAKPLPSRKTGLVNGCKVEADSQGRYFTMSGNGLPGFNKLRSAPDEFFALVESIATGQAQKPPRLLDESLEGFGPVPEHLHDGAVVDNNLSANIYTKKTEPLDIGRFRSAVQAIPPTEFIGYNKWLQLVTICANEAWWHPEHRDELYKICESASKEHEDPKYGVASKYDETNQLKTFNRFWGDAGARERNLGLDAMLGSGTIYKRATELGWKEAPDQTQSQDDSASPAGPAGAQDAGADTAVSGEILNLQMDKRTRQPIANWDNTKKCLRAMGVYVWRDTFSDKLNIDGGLIPPDYSGLINDGVIHWVRTRIFSYYSFDPGKLNITDQRP